MGSQALATPIPFVRAHWVAADGGPCANCLLWTYSAGTSIPQATYTTTAGNVANTNPVHLDGAGYADVFFGPSPYKLVLETAAIPGQHGHGGIIWSEDNITNSPEVANVSYLPPFTGAIVRTSTSKWAEQVSVLDFGADPTGNVDSATAFNVALSVANRQILVPCGIYTFSNQIAFFADSLRLYGQGSCSVLRMASNFPASTNFMTVHNFSHLEIDHLTFDMQNFRNPTQFGEVIFGGEGTTGVYGDISVHDNVVEHNQMLGFGIGSNGNTAQDVRYVNNIFYMDTCSAAEYCGNAIDTGAVGTRLRYTITGNHIVYPFPIVHGVGSGIFMGHGITKNFVVSDNTIENAPSNGMQIYARPFSVSDTSIAAAQYSITGNTINGAGSSGIIIFGGTDIAVTGNTIRNVGQDPTTAGYTPVGIAVTNGVSDFGPPEVDFGAKHISVSGNVITDVQSVHTMSTCGYWDGHVGSEPSGLYANNLCSGFLTSRTIFNVASPAVQVIDPTESTTGIKLSNSTSMQSVGGQLAAYDVLNKGLGTTVMPLVSSANGFQAGVGINCFWDGANWRMRTDTANNGGMCMTGADAGGVNFFNFPSVSPFTSDQTVSQANLFSQHLAATINPLGTFNPPVSFNSATGSMNATMTLAGSVSPNSAGNQNLYLAGVGNAVSGHHLNESIGLIDSNFQAGFGSDQGVNIAHPFAWAYAADSVAFEWYTKAFQTPLSSGNKIAQISTAGNFTQNGNVIQIGGTGGPSWSSGSGTPGGSCTSGSMYTNTAGSGAPSTDTLFVCIAGAWRAASIP